MSNDYMFYGGFGVNEFSVNWVGLFGVLTLL
jgi:hypothetical protein